MTKLSSTDLVDALSKKGIEYLPSKQIYYERFPYRVTMNPAIPGLGTSRTMAARIDVTSPERAKQKLEEFVDRIHNGITNAEKRLEMIDWIDRLPDVEYKKRMGGENQLFYFCNPDLVLAMVTQFSSLVESVTGPLNDAHQEHLSSDDDKVVFRSTLYYKKYRYRITFQESSKFYEDCCDELITHLEMLDRKTWKESKLYACRKYYQFNKNSTRSTYPFRPSPMKNPITIYLTDHDQYIYIKLLASEHIIESHKVISTDELT
jgi:hypothetical protein